MSSLEDFNIKYDSKKYVCSFCGFRTHKKYNLDVNKTNKHRNEILHHPVHVHQALHPVHAEHPQIPMHSNHSQGYVAENQYLQNKVNELQ